jgi:hypothetical protein
MRMPENNLRDPPICLMCHVIRLPIPRRVWRHVRRYAGPPTPRARGQH